MSLPRAKKILVMEVAGLGDNVHLLPALWMLRQNYPDATLHLMCAASSASLFTLTPWVDAVLAYPWNPRPSAGAHLGWGWRLRQARYDLVINFSGSDRTTLLTFMSGAPERWGRRPHDGGMGGFGWFYTRVLEHPFYREPMFVQKWQCLKDAGLAGAAPEFHAAPGPALRRAAGIAEAQDGRYLHLSPCTTSRRRELPIEELATLINALAREFPALPLVISCAPVERERALVGKLVGALAAPPWKVFAGTLELPALASVIEGAALHLGGDTGSLHLALMTATPALAWFRKHAHDAEREWIPPGPRYRTLVSEPGGDRALTGIDGAALLGAARELLENGPP